MIYFLKTEDSGYLKNQYGLNCSVVNDQQQDNKEQKKNKYVIRVTRANYT